MLHSFAVSGSLEELRSHLVWRPELVDSLDSEGDSLVQTAAYYGQAGVIELLAAASTTLLDAANATGWTPLNTAAYQGHYDAVAALIAAGSTAVDTPNHAGLTPLHNAVTTANHNVAALLLTFGASADAQHAGYTARQRADPADTSMRALLDDHPATAHHHHSAVDQYKTNIRLLKSWYVRSTRAAVATALSGAAAAAAAAARQRRKRSVSDPKTPRDLLGQAQTSSEQSTQSIPPPIIQSIPPSSIPPPIIQSISPPIIQSIPPPIIQSPPIQSSPIQSPPIQSLPPPILQSTPSIRTQPLPQSLPPPLLIEDRPATLRNRSCSDPTTPRDMAAAARSSSTCQRCQSGAAVHGCRHCVVNLCEPCWPAVHSCGVLVAHARAPLLGAVSFSPSAASSCSPTRECRTHAGYPRDFLCRDAGCRQRGPLCALCERAEHRHHRSIALASDEGRQLAATTRQQLAYQLQQLHGAERQADALLLRVQQTRSGLVEAQQRAQAQLADKFAQLRRYVDQREAELRQAIDSTAHERLALLDQQSAELAGHVEQLSAVHSRTSALATASDADDWLVHERSASTCRDIEAALAQQFVQCPCAPERLALSWCDAAAASAVAQLGGVDAAALPALSAAAFAAALPPLSPLQFVRAGAGVVLSEQRLRATKPVTSVDDAWNANAQASLPTALAGGVYCYDVEVSAASYAPLMVGWAPDTISVDSEQFKTAGYFINKTNGDLWGASSPTGRASGLLGLPAAARVRCVYDQRQRTVAFALAAAAAPLPPPTVVFTDVDVDAPLLPTVCLSRRGSTATLLPSSLSAST